MAKRKNECGQFNLRVDAKKLDEWREKAARSGLSLSQWIRFQCDGVMVVRTSDKVA